MNKEGRDSYERTDNYNCYGLFCFFYLRMRQAFFSWIGQQPAVLAGQHIQVAGELNLPMQHAYTYELYQPLLAIAMGSKSETVKAMAFETTNMLAYLLRDQKKQFNKLCIF